MSEVEKKNVGGGLLAPRWSHSGGWPAPLTQVSVNPRAVDADKVAELATGPARLLGRTIGADLVLGLLEQDIEALL